MSAPDELLNEVEAFLRTTGMPIARFGREAANDASLVPQLRAGREPRYALRERVRLFMAQASSEVAA